MSYQIENIIEAVGAGADLRVEDFEHEAWRRARPAHIARYWSGEAAPAEKHAEARALWTDAALFVRFVCQQKGALVVAPAPNLREKTIGLWDRDVCEIFIAPDARAPEKYFEFEAAPTGEWIDLAIHWRPEGRETDWRFRSRMTTAARIEESALTIALRIPFKPLGRKPSVGERWRANLFRCVGTDAVYRYLAWQPTHTEQPNFHVPERFGWLDFKA